MPVPINPCPARPWSVLTLSWVFCSPSDFGGMWAPGCRRRGSRSHIVEPVQVNRRLGRGPKALTTVFPGLDGDPNFRALFNDGLRPKVLAKTKVNLVPEDSYAYIDDEWGWVNLGLG